MQINVLDVKMSIKTNSNFFSSFEVTGSWSIPGGNKKIRGTLTFNPNKGGYLSLDGSFYSLSDTLNRNYDQPKILVGQTDTGELITLLKNYIVSANGGFQNIRLTIQSGLILKNFNYSHENDLQFGISGVHIDGIENWFSDSIFSSEFAENGSSVRIKYVEPDDCDFDLSKFGFKIKTKSSVEAPLIPGFDNVKMSMFRHFEIESNKVESLWWHLEKIYELNQFFSILYGEGCLDKQVYLYRRSKEGEERKKFENRVDVFLKPQIETPKKNGQIQILFADIPR